MYDGPLLLGSGSGDGDTSFLTGLSGRLDPVSLGWFRRRAFASLTAITSKKLAHIVKYWQFKLFPWINSVSSSSSSETCASTTLRPSLAGNLNTFQHHRP